jgi:hypothetical protein
LTDEETVANIEKTPPPEEGARYYSTYKRMRYYAYGPQAINNSISVSGSSAGVSCSYAGGCDFEVHADGLSSLLKGSQTINKVKVCDEVCEFDEASSTAQTSKCKLPKLSTTYSDQNFNISEVSEDLRSSSSKFGTLANNSDPFDGVLVKKPTEVAQPDGSCFIGVGFKEGHVGLIS